MDSMFMARAQEIREELVSWRRSIHQHPELGMELPRTAAMVREELERLGIACQMLCDGSAVLGTVGGKRPGKVFLLRGDMDALPIQEETGLPFCSQSGDRMHACGHDLHTAMLLGAAKLLKEREEEIQGVVKLMFQPGEETFQGGKSMVDQGVLENPQVDAAFAMHVGSTVPVGVVGYGKYPMASCDGFRITVQGHGGHGAQPDSCIDPINVGIHIHLALQELISRECSPLEPASLTIGKFSAGLAANVIPDTAVLEGTLRTFSAQVRQQLRDRIREVAQGVAAAYRASVAIETLSEVPSVECREEMNQQLVDYLRSAFGDRITVLPVFRTMGSEDFAFVSQQVPSSFFLLGAAVEDRSQWKPGHNPKVLFHEDCLPLGAAIYAECATRWLQDHQ